MLVPMLRSLSLAEFPPWVAVIVLVNSYLTTTERSRSKSRSIRCKCGIGDVEPEATGGEKNAAREPDTLLEDRDRTPCSY